MHRPLRARTSGGAARGAAPQRAARRRTGLAAPVLALVLAAACQGPPIEATPLPATGVMAQIALLGGSVTDATGGDPGCAEQGQAGLAIHLRVGMPGLSPAEEVYLFTYADRAAWERQADAFARCFALYAGGPLAAGRPVQRIDVSPYRAFGPAWTPGAVDLLARALTAAAGNGG
jgi:hypothetical protein